MRTAAGVLATVAVLVAGCAHTTAGIAVPTHTGPAAGVDDVLLSEADVNKIMGTTTMAVVDESQQMADNSGDVSDTKCLGALYNAEETIYDGSGWTDVADQVVTEPEYDSGAWVEQTAVRFPSPQRAKEFLEKSKTRWTDCIGTAITVDSGSDQFRWRFEGVTIDGASVAQTARQDDDTGWTCRHVLRAVSDVIVEVAACGMALHVEAAEIAEKIAANVE